MIEEMLNGTRINPDFRHPGDDSSLWAKLSGRPLIIEENHHVPRDDINNLRAQYPALATREEPLRVVVFGALGKWFERSGAHAFKYMEEVFPELKLEIIAVDTTKGCDPEKSELRRCNTDGSYHSLPIAAGFRAIRDSTGFEPSRYFTDEEFFRWLGQSGEKIDGFYIAVPPEYHFELLKECLAVGGESPPFVAVEKPLVVPSDYPEFSRIPIKDRSRIIAMDHFPLSTPVDFVHRGQDHGVSTLRDALDLIRAATHISAGANESELVDLTRRGLVLRLRTDGSRLDAGIGLDLLTHPQSMIHRLLPDWFRDIHPNSSVTNGNSLADVRLPKINESLFWQYQDSLLNPDTHEETGAMIRYELCANDRTAVHVSVQGQKGGPYDSHFLVASSEHGEVLIELGQRGTDKISARRPMVVVHDPRKSAGTNTIVHTWPVQKKGRYGHPIAEVLDRMARRDGSDNRNTIRYQIVAAALVVAGKNRFGQDSERYIPVTHNTDPDGALKSPILY